MLSKKDYTSIAACIAQARESARMDEIPASDLAIAYVIDRLCDTFALENDAFNAALFARSCRGERVDIRKARAPRIAAGFPR